jgi:hypothetical protein
VVQDAQTGEPLGDLRRRHRGAVVAERCAWQAALLERLAEPVRDDLGGLGQIPLQVTGKPRSVVEHAEQNGRHPLATFGEHLARTVMAVPVPQAINVLSLVAAHLAIGDAGLGALGTVGSARCHAPPPGEAIVAHEPAQRGVGRHRLKLGPRFGQRDQVVVMELDAPALVRGVLREDGLAHGIADRNLLSGVGAQLAAEHADWIGALLQGPVIPSLDGREAELDLIAGGRMLPCAGGERRDRRLQLTLGGWRRQQLADHGEAQMRPPLVDPCASRWTSCLLDHAGTPAIGQHRP